MCDLQEHSVREWQVSVSVRERWKACSVGHVTGNRFAMSEGVKPKARASPQHCFVVGCHNRGATVYLVSNLGPVGVAFRGILRMKLGEIFVKSAGDIANLIFCLKF